MDLTSDLINIQSILSSLIKKTGEFTRVNYKGGNEDVIMKVMLDVQGFLKNQKYITEDNKPNELYNKQLEDVVLFLALNTSYKHPLEMDEYSHLINITPPLSKCLFANVVYGLDLCQYYCMVIEKLPINNSIELLDEVLQCLKKSIPNIQLKYANMFLQAAANKLSRMNYTKKDEEPIDNLCEVTGIMLQYLNRMSADHIKNWKKDQIYVHMGLCLLHLFELLLNCDVHCLALRKFIGNVIQTCSSIIRNVTLDVYCAWAEEEVEDEILQTLISNKAYLVLESYQKLTEARDLIAVLGSIAKKPKSLTEQILEADVKTIIKKVNKKDNNQKFWFKALLTNYIFENSDAFKCVRRWYQLCDEEDVLNLLNSSISKNNKETIELAIKCAAHLNLPQLTIVATKYFYKNKFPTLGSMDVEKPLTQLLNKVKEDSDVKSDLTKDIIVLFIQQPQIILTRLFEECLKNSFYTNILKGTFSVLKDVIKINNIGTSVLCDIILKKPPNPQFIDNYIQLLKTLIAIECLSKEDILLKVLAPLLNKHHEEKNLEEMDLILQMFSVDALVLPVIEDTKDLVSLILIVMNENRCKFLNFYGIKQQITKHTVDICLDVCKQNYKTEVEFTIAEEDSFTRYYRTCLTSGKELSLFKNLDGNNSFDIKNYGNCVNTLLKFIPSAVSREWLLIAQEIVEICGINKCMELFTDVLILLSQLVETQDAVLNSSIYLALKDCVRNYGLVVQQKFLDNSTLETEVHVNRQICRLLAKLPNSLKEEEGITLINILSDRSLKSLAKDKDFLCHLILIKNPMLCQILAQKITS